MVMTLEVSTKMSLFMGICAEPLKRLCGWWIFGHITSLEWKVRFYTEYFVFLLTCSSFRKWVGEGRESTLELPRHFRMIFVKLLAPWWNLLIYPKQSIPACTYFIKNMSSAGFPKIGWKKMHWFQISSYLSSKSKENSYKILEFCLLEIGSLFP